MKFDRISSICSCMVTLHDLFNFSSFAEFMPPFEAIPQPIREKWERVMGLSGISNDSLLFRDWYQELSHALLNMARVVKLDQIPSEVMNILLNVDQYSVEYLWMKVSRSTDQFMTLDRVRLLVETLLTEKCSIRITPTAYTKWLAQLLGLLEADEDRGIITRDAFLSRFAIWSCSRLWCIPIHRHPIEEIVFSWRYLDIGDSGVLSHDTIKDYLLPYAFRLLYPETAKDDSKLKEVWIEEMLPLFTGTRNQWINHWTEFKTLNTKLWMNYVTHLESRKSLAERALSFFGVDAEEDQFLFLEDLIALGAPFKLHQSRILGLWVVSLNHPNYVHASMSSMDTKMDPVPFCTSQLKLKEYCLLAWTGGAALAKTEKTLFEAWSKKVLTACTVTPEVDDNILVLRKEFVDRFPTKEESNFIWNKFAGTDPDNKLTTQALFSILRGIYEAKGFKGPHQGEWIIDDWMHEFVTMISAKYCLPGVQLVVGKAVFAWAFPLLYASIEPKWHVPIDPRIESVWPITHKDVIIYSKPVMRNFLREIWAKVIPPSLNMPCQQWWIDRVTGRLIEDGKGITRDKFYSIFLHPDETFRICMQELNSRNLTRILTMTAEQSSLKNGLIPTEFVEEFFLLTDVNPEDPMKGNKDDFKLDRKIFQYAFPLWFAAHSAID